MQNLLARKLEGFAKLSDEDRSLLNGLISKTRKVAARTDLIKEGEAPDDVHLILEGFACRYKFQPSGARQIMAYLVPGDFCDLHVFILREMDHSIATLSRCLVVDIPRPKVLEMTKRPALAQALWWATLVDEATLREWLVNVGGRPAEQRLAHLLCELWLRLRAVGLTSDGSYELPVTQAELADTTGLSTVHVNRVLQSLRGQNLITLKGKHLVIPDVERLMEFSAFNPNYLHLQTNRRP
jgi:CRP-like cAMP-binding protein